MKIFPKLSSIDDTVSFRKFRDYQIHSKPYRSIRKVEQIFEHRGIGLSTLIVVQKNYGE